MAQRRRAGRVSTTSPPGLLFRTGSLLPFPARRTGKPEECQSVPAGAGDRSGDRAERGIMPVLIPESLRQNLHQDAPSLPLAREQGARQGEAVVLGRASGVGGRCLDARTTDVKETSWCDRSQVGIACDLAGPLASPLGEIAFDQRLQTPGDPTEQMPAMQIGRASC